jgi:hypothetical protein
LLHQFEIVPAAVNWHHPRYSFAHVSVNIEKQKDIYEVLKRAEVREAEISSLRSPSYQENELKQSRRLLRFARNDKKRTAAVSNSETLVIADFSEMVDPSRPDQFSEVEIAELLTNPAVSDSDVRVQIYNGEMAKNMGLYQDLRDLIGQLEARHPHLEGKIELRREALSELRDEIEMHVGPVVSIFKNLDVLDELKHLKLDGRVLAFRNDAAGTLGVAVEAADAIRKSTADLLKKALPESVNWNQESSYFTAVASHARAWLDRYDQALVVLFARAA